MQQSNADGNHYDDASPQSAEFFRLIIENIKDYAIFMTDPDGTVVSWNPGVEQLLGYSESEIVGQPISVIFTPEDRAANAPAAEIERAARCGRAEDKRWHVRRDGSRFWANGMVMPLKTADGALRGFAKVMRDDTKRKLAEDDLEKVLSSIADSFYRFDRNFHYTYVNRATTEMFGIEEKDFLGKTLAELFPDVEGNIFHKEVRRAFETQERAVFENHYPPLDRWFENRVYPSPEGLSVFTSEITERKRAELKLQETSQILNAINLTTPTLIYVKDRDSRILSANPATARVLGRPLSEIVGKPPAEYLLDAADAARIADNDRRILETGATETFEETVAMPDGAPHVFLSTKTPHRNEREEIIGLIGVSMDITRRKRAEEKLRDSEAQMRALADTIPQLAWMANPDGSIFWYNRRWYEYTGTTAEEMAGWGWQTVHDPAMLPRVVERWQHSLATGEPFEMEFPIKSAAGEFRWFLTRVNALRDSSGSITRWFGTNTDIEELRQAALEAEQANRLKDEFLATLSHELRTPLNAILGWSQMLQNRDLEEADRKKALATIERSARAQNQLIEDLLDVSRIITGKLRLDVRAVDLPGVIQAAADAARPAAEAKNIRLQTLLDPQAGPISGDPDRLQQVVWNLLSNAIKFTPKNGRVQARLERVNSHVEIVVSDTGRGIALEFLPHVFDRFRQFDGSMTRRHGGLGLGLAIVRQLVELHGGTVAVTSAGEDQGATFTVCFPLLPVRREPPGAEKRAHPTANEAPPADCPPELDGLRVLLVDDEADSRELLHTVLHACGAQVTAAATAAEALNLIKRERFDCLVSDIGMPEEDGFALIGKIRNLPNGEGGDVPAIALTAYARAEDRVQALRSGFQMHVAKPVEPAELVVVVANLAGRLRNPKK